LSDLKMFAQNAHVLQKVSANLNQHLKCVHTLRSNFLIPVYNMTHGQAKTHHEGETQSVSHSILLENGFITDSTAAGFLTALPLGKRVLNKLTELVRFEMSRIGGQEIEMPTLCDLKLWKKTGRAELMGSELFTLKDRKQKEMCLCPTHEEILTSLVSDFSKKLPMHCLDANNSLRLYQITRKYRDESRPKHGLLRTREFLMKDMYTFHTTEQCVKKTYSGNFFLSVVNLLRYRK
jgi:prolyl-tRNA synthetase